MFPIILKRISSIAFILSLNFSLLSAQEVFKLKYKNSTVYAGIEIGSKGVKLSVVEIGKNAKTRGAFNILKDTAVNTDFISFSQPTFQATLNAIYNLYSTSLKEYKIPANRIFTVISSGVKVQAEKEEKTKWINDLTDSFRLRIGEPGRRVELENVLEEARLSHLGIVPEEKRYTTFLIDIGSGNTKGGYFPDGNTKDFYLFQLSWGTKSTANETEKRCIDDKSLSNYNKQLSRVIFSVENSEIIYAVNASGAYPLSDNIALSGGIAWSIATLLHPEMIDESVVPVTFSEVEIFSERLYNDFASLSDVALTKKISNDPKMDKIAITKTIKSVHQVFDQRSLMAGTSLLLKIMRQFVSVHESKQFFLVKNGQVGWVSAYVDEAITK